MEIRYDYSIFSAQRFGGISRYFCELAARLSVCENLRIAAPIFVNDFLQSAKVSVDGVKIGQFRGSTRLAQAASRQLTRLIYASAEPRIVHETYYGPDITFPRAQKRVVTIHDMIPEIFDHSPDIVAFKRAAVERADAIICVSETTKLDLMRIVAVDERRIKVIPLASSLSQISASLPPLLLERPFVLFVGVRRGYKNFGNLLKAFAATRSVMKEGRLLCFGGPPFGREDRDLMTTLGIPELSVVHVTGNDALLAACYTNATLLVCPSLYEGFGLPVLEAMAVGCPVCCSASGSLMEVAGNSATFFDPHDHWAIAQTLDDMWNDEPGRTVAAASGRKRAKSFNWDVSSRSTLQLYRDL